MAQDYDTGLQLIVFMFSSKAVLRTDLGRAESTRSTEESVQAVAKTAADTIEIAIGEAIDNYVATSVPRRSEERSKYFTGREATLLQEGEFRQAYEEDIKEVANDLTKATKGAVASITEHPHVQEAIKLAVQSVVKAEQPIRENSESLSFPALLHQIEQRIQKWRAQDSPSIDQPYLPELISKLNLHSGIVAEKIEQELQKSLPPYIASYITVKVDVNFKGGSLLIIGTVLLNWVGSIAFQAAKEVLEEEFGESIKIAVKRVFADMIDYLRLSPYFSSLQDVTVNVRPQTRVPRANAASTSQNQSQRGNGVFGPWVKDNLYPQIILWIILITVLIMLADRYLTISLKP